jgi:tetratricopeptide (TPR) repeat protein
MMQHMALTPVYTKIRFGLWDDLLDDTPMPADIPYLQAITHTARGLALAARGQVDDADKELAAVAAVKDDPALKTLYVSSVNTASAITAIANEVLAGEIAAKRKNAGEAVRRFEAAAKLEAGLTYMEPPDWPVPVRQLQGAALLELGRARDAEAAFRADMVKFPDNAWSLTGLQASLSRQGRTQDAAALQPRVDRALRTADTKIVAGRPQ